MALLTVLICTHDREQLLGKALAALDAADRPPEGVQLLVVANACRDGTHAMLEARARDPQGRLPLQWVAEPVAGKSHALNTGLAHVKTPLVAFVDDDQRAERGYLNAICDAARAMPEAALICGSLTPDWTGEEPAWVHTKGPYRVYPLPVPNFDLGPEPRLLGPDGPIPSGGNFAVRREWIDRVGPFSTELGPRGHDLGGAEDSEWLDRALALGARLYYTPAMRQRHFVESDRLSLTYLMRKACKRTEANVVLHGGTLAGRGVPLYVYRKLAGYALNALTSLGAPRRRFYLMRTAGAWGELVGYRRLLAQARTRLSGGG